MIIYIFDQISNINDTSKMTHKGRGENTLSNTLRYCNLIISLFCRRNWREFDWIISEWIIAARKEKEIGINMELYGSFRRNYQTPTNYVSMDYLHNFCEPPIRPQIKFAFHSLIGTVSRLVLFFYNIFKTECFESY